MPQVKGTFTLKADDVDKLRNAMTNLGESSERVISDYLHNVAGEKIAKSITRFIPTSDRKKIHAKESKWWEQTNNNLAVTIANSMKGTRGKSFYYLYYVATGTGTSKDKGKNDFMEKGIEAEYNNIVDGLLNAVEENIRKELN